MAEPMLADASPEKRLFISLLTRDIPLVAAFLDLVDNSVNAAVEPYSQRLRSATDFYALLGDKRVKPVVQVSLEVAEDRIVVRDTAGGISAVAAGAHVFRFGRGPGEFHPGDRLSVYGIGLKRAMFKLGNRIVMRSDHAAGGFDMDLNVSEWAKASQERWGFEILPRAAAAPNDRGTIIKVTELHDEVQRRLSDGVFEGQLREAIAKTYAYYMAKFVTIRLGSAEVEPLDLEIGSNHTLDELEMDGVTCAITAGIGIPQAGGFRERSSGWFVFCNGRAVVSADKTPLTGWGAEQGLPIFQPKHRPFLGSVFFVSEDPERLPWTTTKSGINEDSLVWQRAKRQMAAVGRTVVSFLDGRYTDEGTEVASKDLQEAAGDRVSVISAAAAKQHSFIAPKAPRRITTRIQYDAHVDDIKRIAGYLKRPSMSGSEVGRHTFNYFLRNEVGEK